MENFLFALNTVLPFLLYIAFGYGVRMSGLADEDFMKRLNKVIFQAFFPILMFNNLYSIPEGMTLNLRLVAVAIISVLLLQAVLLAVVPRLVKENERRGVIIQAIYRSNFVLFGIPLATSVFGEEGTLLATMMVAIVIPVYNQIHYTYACLLSILENTKDVTYEIWNCSGAARSRFPF